MSWERERAERSRGLRKKLLSVASGLVCVWLAGAFVQPEEVEDYSAYNLGKAAVERPDVRKVEQERYLAEAGER